MRDDASVRPNGGLTRTAGQRCDDGTTVAVMSEANQEGRAVRVTRGPFEGLRAVVLDARGAASETVSVELFGTTTTAEIERDALVDLDGD